jgi:hypothetical protein
MGVAVIKNEGTGYGAKLLLQFARNQSKKYIDFDKKDDKK